MAVSEELVHHVSLQTARGLCGRPSGAGRRPRRRGLRRFYHYPGSPADSLMRENQDTLEVIGIPASDVNVVIHV